MCHAYFHRMIASCEKGGNIPNSSAEEHVPYAACSTPEACHFGPSGRAKSPASGRGRRDSITHGAATGSLSFRRASQADRAEKSDARSSRLSHHQQNRKHNKALLMNIVSKSEDRRLADRKCEDPCSSGAKAILTYSPNETGSEQKQRLDQNQPRERTWEALPFRHKDTRGVWNMKTGEKTGLTGRELSARLTGIKTPVGGNDWEPPAEEQNSARQVLPYLAEQRTAGSSSVGAVFNRYPLTSVPSAPVFSVADRSWAVARP